MASRLKFRKYPGCQSKFGLNMKSQNVTKVSYEFYVYLNKTPLMCIYV